MGLTLWDNDTGTIDLDRLVAPRLLRDFIDGHWQRRHFHVTGDPDRFDGLFDTGRLVEAMQRQPAADVTIRASFDTDGDDGQVGNQIPVEPHDIGELYERGASVCVDPIDRADPTLAAFVRQLVARLHHAGEVKTKCYLSSDGFGFNRHFDPGEVMTLQIEGNKRWRFSRDPAIRFPSGPAFASPDGALRYRGRLPSELADWERLPHLDEDDFEEVLLTPGDMLCLPAGTWHEAKAVGGSLSLAITFAPLRAGDVLWPLLMAMMAERPEWRMGAPSTLDPPADGGAPADVEAFYVDRLHELADAAGALARDHSSVGHAWRDRFGAGLADIGRPTGGSGSGPARPRSGATPTSDDGSRAQLPTPRPSPVTEGVPFTGRLDCVLNVANLDASVEWYRSTLGLEVESMITEFGWAQLTTPVEAVRIGLSEVHSAVDSGALVNFGVEDIDEARGALESSGVQFDGPTRVIVGVAKLASFVDPDGNPLMIYEPL